MFFDILKQNITFYAKGEHGSYIRGSARSPYIFSLAWCNWRTSAKVMCKSLTHSYQIAEGFGSSPGASATRNLYNR